MGYHTEFEGSIDVFPPLNEQEIAYLKSFANSRRMDREKGPYFVEGTSYAGQCHDSDVRNYNAPPEGQPSLWCKWEPTEDGTSIEWNGAEKFYGSIQWMQYLIEHFIGETPLAKKELPFLNSHVLHGKIEAHGEDRSDHWFLIVENNEVRIVDNLRMAPPIAPLDKELVTHLSNNEKHESQIASNSNTATSSKVNVEKQTDNLKADNMKEFEATPKVLYVKKTSRFNL